jgi:hypothetical protein
MKREHEENDQQPIKKQKIELDENLLQAIITVEEAMWKAGGEVGYLEKYELDVPSHFKNIEDEYTVIDMYKYKEICEDISGYLYRNKRTKLDELSVIYETLYDEMLKMLSFVNKLVRKIIIPRPIWRIYAKC